MIRLIVAVLGGLLALCACQVSQTTQAGMLAAREADGSQRAAVRLQLATEYLAAGQHAVARDEAAKAIGTDPGLAAAYHVRALAYLGLRESAPADRDFRAALSLRPDDADILNNYGWFLCEGERYADGLSYLRRAAQVVAPATPVRALVGQGVCQLRSGDAVAARGSLLQALERDGGNPAALTNLALAYYRLADFDHAAQYVADVNGGPSANAESVWLGARIAHRQGDNAREADLLAQLRTRFPTSREMTAYEQGAWDE